MIFEPDDEPPKSAVRSRLDALEAMAARDRARLQRRHHRPDLAVLWLALVLLSVLAAVLLVTQ